MTPSEIIIHNEKINYRRIFDMLDVIEKAKFDTDEGKEMHSKLKESIKEIIRPAIIESANKMINNVNNNNQRG